ncbi:kinase-like protein [Lophiostoma macrostomum CBS 122681]|uniref:Kinase-like protein n=1 Tax=Lophiostoma macrostomum CBS 122681 TaxID=1314788 RepID=A0A6A6SQA3_9PLEO|nr:kinase-like protein [Lophiostoma macrostomum CBS 122681]
MNSNSHIQSKDGIDGDGNGEASDGLTNCQDSVNNTIIKAAPIRASAGDGPPPQILPPSHAARESDSPIRRASRTLKDYFVVDEEPRVVYTDAECLEIARLLRANGKETWATIPRIYIVLRTIRQLSVIESFLDAGIDDFWLPMSEKALRAALASNLHSQFLDTQRMVLTKGFRLERGIGSQRHASFERHEPLPFRILNKLGAGGYGTVHKIESVSSGEFYARKAFRRLTTNDGRDFVNELQITKKINHLHCVRIVASYTDPDLFCLILSPVADCNLSQFYESAVDSSEQKTILRTFYGCLASALSYLHQTKIRHRDIKPSNILVQWVKGREVKAKVYLADFGISLDWAELSGSTTTDNTAKTKIYCAPEVAEWKPRNSASDIWSLGCVYLEMYTVLKGKTIAQLREHLTAWSGELHFRNAEAVETWIENLVSEPRTLDDQVVAWVNLMLRKNHSDRISAHTLQDEIMQSTFEEQPGVTAFSCQWCMYLPESIPVSMSESELSGLGNTLDTRTNTMPTSPLIDGKKSSSPPPLPESALIVSSLSVQSLPDENSEREKSTLVVNRVAIADRATGRSSPETQEQFDTTIFTPEILSKASSLKNHLPKLSGSSWRDPGQFLMSIEADTQLMQYLRVHHYTIYQAFRRARVDDIPAVLKMLLEAGLDPNDPQYIDDLTGEEGSCPHLWVLCPVWTNVIPPALTFGLLVHHGADAVHYKMKGGRTALTRASAFGLIDEVRTLVSLGSSINGNARSITPLQSAVKYQKLETVKYLIEIGADVNASSESHPQPLILAAENGSLPIFKHLVEHGAHPDCRLSIEKYNVTRFRGNITGSPPLSIAALKCRFGVLKYMLEV